MLAGTQILCDYSLQYNVKNIGNQVGGVKSDGSSSELSTALSQAEQNDGSP